jgi:hypothetical protein
MDLSQLFNLNEASKALKVFSNVFYDESCLTPVKERPLLSEWSQELPSEVVHNFDSNDVKKRKVFIII